MADDPQAHTDRQWLSRVFAGSPGPGRPLARGNTAMVAQLSPGEIPQPGLLQARASRAAVATSCFFASSGFSSDFPVFCFNRSHAIQCCGHGLYAVASVLHNEIAARVKGVAMGTGTTKVIAQLDGQEMAIALPLLDCSESPMPSWASGPAGVAPVAIAHAGGADGYALWIYSSVDQVINLQLAGETLLANTRRAIIATSWDTTVASGFVLRYFAPQYGVPEDPVTGSAMRIAAQYWRQHSGNNSFQVWQCSATGGVAQLNLDQQYCWIKGSHVSTLLPEAS